MELPAISRQIWESKYRYCRDGQPVDRTLEDTWRRVANAVAAKEAHPKLWAKRFYELLAGFRFLPGGRILANAGTGRHHTTLFNCYVMGTIADSIAGIFQAVKEAAITQKQGGGVGFDFSTIRPRGSHIAGVDAPASGPLSFMQVLDATCKTILSAGQRRGAQMGILRCDHPDIEAFIAAKRQEGVLRMFNLSVAVTDAFMKAVADDADWPLLFAGKEHKRVRARELWDRLMRATYDCAEPGVVMIDRVNALNNLWYCEEIRATNPCGEQPLPPYGACLLGSFNLTAFVREPFSAAASFDFAGLAKAAATAVRFLDNVIDLSNFPLPRQAEEAQGKRRMGLGITGLADALIFLGLPYGEPAGRAFAEKAMRTLKDAAYDASADLAAEKGAFPAFDRDKCLQGAFIRTLPPRLRAKIRQQGLRNSHLTSIAPTGTISLLAGNLSSGIEPVFAFHYVRKVREGAEEHEVREHEVLDFAYAEYCRRFGRPEADEKLPPAFVTADRISPVQHIEMQAALQKHVDSSISKTINVPADFPFEAFKEIYQLAYEHGLKGCTTFRPSEQIAGVLVRREAPRPAGPAAALAPAPLPAPGAVAKARRPPLLHGTTYKVRTPVSKEAFYVTINDLEEHGRRRPYEIFINTKNLQHFSWIVAMTRLTSAIFRREEDPAFLVEELTSIYDPAGGYFSEGEFVPSLPAAIGKVIGLHLRRLGLLPENGGGAATAGEGGDARVVEAPASASPGFGFCPACNQPKLIAQEGCLKCLACGYSKCS
ncbi:MAG: adenosylcobalamin-dependent ribonucleoside-diphosphate reductase [Lentisphaeria bacterium]|jgi:ribonucleoside-diphosphate reductase alpha chain